MKIVSCYTPNLRPFVGPLKESLSKFAPDHLVIEHEPEAIKSFTPSWPRNRFMYCTAQGGEFLDLAEFQDGELICFIDADTIMQRPITEEELEIIRPEKGEFTANFVSYPPRSLNDVVKSLMCTSEVVSRDSYLELSAACLIAHKEDWIKLRDIYIPFFKSIRKNMGHHATTQWLISHIIQWRFNMKIAPDWFHNAEWYDGTRAKMENTTLRVGRKDVCFNHTKFQNP